MSSEKSYRMKFEDNIIINLDNWEDSDFEWRHILSQKETNKYFILKIMLSDFLIPKTAFDSEEKIEQFRNLLKEKMEKK